MAILSMTGFGSGRAFAGGIRVEVQLNSLNRKQFDFRASMPKSVAAMESRLGELIHKRIIRGAVHAVVEIAVFGAARARAVTVDVDAARGYVEQLRKIGRKLGLEDDLGLRTLTCLPEVVRINSMPVEQEAVWKLVEKAACVAVGQLEKARIREGQALRRDIEKRLAGLENKVRQIRKIAPAIPERYKAILMDRLARAGIKTDDQDVSLAREIVFFADRSDITEELVRLDSHFVQARTLIGSAQPSGRPMDFLCQEMFREINTIGSKANDAEITTYVVGFKTELECVREQIQNVE